MRTRALALTMCLASLLSAGCQEDAGIIQVTKLQIRGAKAVEAKRIKAVLATRASARLPWGTKRHFSRARFEGDLQRIVAFYADRGYPNARVVSTDIDLNDAQNRVSLSITIDEGEPLKVEGVELAGFDVLPRDHFDELQAGFPIKEGQPRDRQLVQAGKDVAANELKDHGLPYASVELSESPGSGPNSTRLTFKAVPGQLARFGPIEITGNKSVGDEVIRRHLSFTPGQLFRLSQVQESQRKLYGLELFEFANIEASTEGSQPAEVPTRVTVTEGKHRRVNFGVGYGSEEKARVDGQWRHVNFFGGARSAGVQGRWSSLDRGVRLDFGQPYLFHPKYSLGVTGQTWFANEPAYRQTTRGGRLTVTRRDIARDALKRTFASTTVSAVYINEFEDYTIAPAALADATFRDELIAFGLDPVTGRGRGTLRAIALDFQRNTTPNLLDARHGYVAAAHLEQAGRFLPGAFDYLEFTMEGRHYVTVAGRAVVASKVRFGAIDGRTDASVPFFKRYFLGGSTSLRGWGRFEVSPLHGGLPIGGFTKLEATSELRIPIVGNLGAVVFVDAGNVWADPWNVDFGSMRYDAGPGFRYHTPIGPVRVDLGWQLNPIPGLLVNGKPEPRRMRLHFSIGQAF